MVSFLHFKSGVLLMFFISIPILQVQSQSIAESPSLNSGSMKFSYYAPQSLAENPVFTAKAGVEIPATKKDQDSMVRGTVTSSETGEPIPGVNVLLKGTSNGVITDLNGVYRINVPDENATLIFSFIGFLTKEVPVSGQSSIDISLEPDVKQLSEVVVIGYGTENKKDLTGSVATVSPKDFEKQPIIQVEDALKGRAAGVQVQKPSGAPGAGMKIRIRGANSINGSSDPLYVIDGYVGADISTIHPNDIESINVLKDASSTAIYGARGANGVVIITTKNAKKGQSRIEFNSFYSIDQVSKKYDLLSGAEYMETVNARQNALELGPIFTDEDIAEIRASGGTDWQDEIFRTGGTQNYQLSYSGSTEKTNFYLSGTVADQKGIVENSFYKRYGLRTNISSEFSERFTLDLNLYGTLENSRNNYTYNGRGNAVGAALIFSPNIPVIDETTGDYTKSPAYGPIAGNPVFSATELNHDSEVLTVLGNTQLSYKIMEGLRLSISGGLNISYFNNPYFKRYGPGSNITSTEAGQDNGHTLAYQNTNILNYKKTFADIHTLDISAIYEQQVSEGKTNGAWATGFSTIALGYNNLGLGETSRVYSGFQDWSLQSYIGRINYNLMERYLFTATLRVDGSSRFQDDNKYGYFPSGAIAWRLSEEPFLQGSNIFEDLKIRASHGLTGSQAVGPYKTLNVLKTAQNYPFDGSNLAIGVGPGNPANPDLKWETTAQTDIGLDFALFKGRLSGTVDYYYKKTTDLILNVTIPDYAGGGIITSNVGALQNKGLEFALSGAIIENGLVSITSGLNFSLNRSKVLDLGKEEEIFTAGGYSQMTNANPFIIKVGEPLGQFRGLVFDGIWQSDQAAEAAKFGQVPGDPRYADLDGNNKIDGEDMTSIGNAQPDYVWGWNTSIRVSNFDLNVLVTAVQGNDVWNFTRQLVIGSGTDVPNPTSVDIRNRWTPQNQNTNIPGFSTTSVAQAQSSMFVEDGSFIRLNNITLGYNLPMEVAGRIGLNNLRIYASTQNILTFTNYSGFDPEISSTPTSSDVAQGIDNATYPAVKTFTLGLKLGF